MKYTILFAAAIGCYAQNISSLSAEIQRAPTAALYADRAAAYLAAGDARGALADTDRALDKDALNVRALSLRAQANSKLGRFSAAVTDLSGAISLAPTDAALYVQRSEAYAAVGDQPRALADRTEALRLDPTVVAALDKKPTAVPETVTAVVPPPAPAKEPAREPTVIAPVAPPPASKPASKSSTVTTAPAVAVTEPPSSDGDNYQRAKTLLNANKTAEAIAAMDAAIKAQPRNAIYYNTRGYAHYLAKDIKKALADYDEAIKINPDYLNALHNRAIARKAAGDKAGSDADRAREAELSKKK